eukprot:760852-Hanusia_phi.AAC.8
MLLLLATRTKSPTFFSSDCRCRVLLVAPSHGCRFSVFLRGFALDEPPPDVTEAEEATASNVKVGPAPLRSPELLQALRKHLDERLDLIVLLLQRQAGGELELRGLSREQEERLRRLEEAVLLHLLRHPTPVEDERAIGVDGSEQKGVQLEGGGELELSRAGRGGRKRLADASAPRLSVNAEVNWFPAEVLLGRLVQVGPGVEETKFRLLPPPVESHTPHLRCH